MCSGIVGVEQSPSDRCGYTYPEDQSRGESPNQQHCCYRETLPDATYCPFHTPPDETDEKTVEALRDARAPLEIRQINSPYNELLDGAIFSGMQITDSLSFENVALRDSTFDGVNLTDASFNNASLVRAIFTDSNITGADLCEASLGKARLDSATLTDADLANTALPYADLTDASLSGANLTEAVLAEANLSSAILTGADLSDASLNDATLPDVDFADAQLQDADLSGATLTDATLTGAALNDANLTASVLNGADFAEASLSDATLRRASLRNSDFRNAILRNIDLTDADARATDFIDTILEDANLTGAECRNSDFTGADLSFADLTDTGFFDADFTDATLGGATLNNATFANADLQTTDLPEGEYLKKADLSEANLQGQNLRGMDLAGATLSKTNLTGVDLEGADLTGANLERALLDQADLFDARLSGARLDGTIFGDVQINELTFQHLTPSQSDISERGSIFNRCWRILCGPSGQDAIRCVYDPKCSHSLMNGESSIGVVNDGGNPPEVRAAGVYRELERLAKDNAHPDWQRRFFILRQDMQTRQYQKEGSHLKFWFAILQRTLFGYGEHFSRVIGWSAGIILLFALVYLLGGWIHPVTPDGGLGDPISWRLLPENPEVVWRSIYYSTLTFTALGFGDFRPTSPFGQLFTVLETTTGAVLLALLVFVLGRRASR